jgi:hypothetical protein
MLSMEFNSCLPWSTTTPTLDETDIEFTRLLKITLPEVENTSYLDVFRLEFEPGPPRWEAGD